MKITKLFLAVACLMGLVASTFAQFAQTEPSPWNVNSADPETNASRAHSARGSMKPEAVAPTTGTFVFNFTITLSSTISTSTQIGCGAILTVTGDKITTSINEQANAVAIRSGNTATCTFDIPYSWALGNPTTDKVSVLYGVASPASGGTVPIRTSQQRLASISLPANGATTTETIAVTL